MTPENDKEGGESALRARLDVPKRHHDHLRRQHRGHCATTPRSLQYENEFPCDSKDRREAGTPRPGILYMENCNGTDAMSISSSGVNMRISGGARVENAAVRLRLQRNLPRVQPRQVPLANTVSPMHVARVLLLEHAVQHCDRPEMNSSRANVLEGNVTQ